MKSGAGLLPSPPEGEGLGERGNAAKRLGYAKQMRSTPTPWEHQLWQELRTKRFAGIKFKRQQSIGPYIVDFVALSPKLIIELDGGQHDSQREYDALRDNFLKVNGFAVVRIWNSEWAENRTGALEQIWLSINRHPLPGAYGDKPFVASPLKGEGLEQ